MTTYDPPLDQGITLMVDALRAAAIETFESCEGGPGHAYPEPTVRFHGDHAEGYRALAIAMRAGLPVKELRRVWPVNDGEPTGPWWELTFRRYGGCLTGKICARVPSAKRGERACVEPYNRHRILASRFTRGNPKAQGYGFQPQSCAFCRVRKG